MSEANDQNKLLGEKNQDLLSRYVACQDEDEKESLLEEIVSTNIGLVHELAKQYGDLFHYSREDLVQVGSLALVKAVRNFDPSFKTSFSTFAYKYIQTAIRDEFNENSSVIKIPKSVRNKLKKIRETEEKLYQELNHKPSSEEICTALNHEFSVSEIEEILSLGSSVLSSDQPLKEDEEATLEDVVADDTESSDPAEISKREMDHKHLEEALESLSERNKSILLEYNTGLVSYEELSKKHGVSVERIRQIILESEQDIREYFAKKHY